jgi:dienelactone hydrolase
MHNPYWYINPNRDFKCILKEENELWSRYAVVIPSAFKARYLENSDIVGEYCFPKGQAKTPLTILVHGMGDRTLAKKGMASFMLYLVFHSCRAPALLKGKYPRLTAEQWFESYQISVTDIRQVIDWADSRPEIIQDKISVLGISLGGLVSTIAMGLDKRLKAGIFIVCGGNSEKITKNSPILRWRYKLKKAEYNRNQETYASYLSAVEEKGFEEVVAEKRSYLTDPLTFAAKVKNRPVLMLNALWDEMIPRVATLELWRALGKPPIKWYPATHASLWLWYPFIGRQITDFLVAVYQTP